MKLKRMPKEDETLNAGNDLEKNLGGKGAN